MQLGLVETLAVAENAGVLTETFAMVRGDDQPGLLQNPAPVPARSTNFPSCSSRSAMQSS